jgi:hypothetical protein
LRDLRDEEEGVFIQGREIVSASFLPPAYELRAFFLQSHTLTTSSGAKQYLPLPPFLFFSLSITIHLDLAKCMHWETAAREAKYFSHCWAKEKWD